MPTRNLLFPGFELPQPVFSAPDEFEKVQIAQHLKLLPDFVAHVTIRRMKLRQTPLQTVGLWQSEFSFVQRTDRIQDIERPASLFGV